MNSPTLPPPGDARVVFGIGNPGPDYHRTRHNLGFGVVEALAAEAGRPLRPLVGLNAVGALVELEGRLTWLVEPLTYVNRCGPVLARIMARDALPLPQALVIVDDIALDPGRRRLRGRGSDGGHNGLYSIGVHLETDRFARLRLGIGGAPEGVPLEQHVLGEMGDADWDAGVASGAEAVRIWARDGLERAQGEVNRETGANG